MGPFRGGSGRFLRKSRRGPSWCFRDSPPPSGTWITGVPLVWSTGSAGMLPGSAGMLPGIAAHLRYFLSGVPLGYGDLAKPFKFAVPTGYWRVESNPGSSREGRNPAGPGGFPSLPPRRPPPDRSTLPRYDSWRPFFGLFFVFGLRARFGVFAKIAAVPGLPGIGPGAVLGRPGDPVARFRVPRGAISGPPGTQILCSR